LAQSFRREVGIGSSSHWWGALSKPGTCSILPKMGFLHHWN